jgi:hypothetical protein
MIDFRQTMLDFMLTTDASESSHKRPFVLLTVSKLNVVISQNRMNLIRHDGNQLS